MKCDEIREMLPAYVKDRDVSLEVRRHLSRCDGCRAELARYEALEGALVSMRGGVVEPPEGLRAALLQIPENAGRVEALRTHVARNRKKYAGAAALAAGALGAAALRSRRHRTALA
jgi:anti-sigma factor RsiW